MVIFGAVKAINKLQMELNIIFNYRQKNSQFWDKKMIVKIMSNLKNFINCQKQNVKQTLNSQNMQLP